MGTLATRRVEIVAQDPSVKQNGRIVTASVSIPYEDLLPGPMGYAVHVVDYDASSQTYYKPAIVPGEDIKAPDDILGDPTYHAVNAYAIVMRTLQRFEFALGRRIAWGTGGPQLKVVPHAFEQANAFYSEDAEALVFGYVRSSGAPTFFGLSHDIIVHETTHALLDGLRDGFTEPSSPDQAALHEGLADIVALLSVFSLPEILVPFIDRVGTRAVSDGETRPPRGMLFRDSVTRARLEQTVLLGLADEIRGDEPDARVNALRRSVTIKPRPGLLDEWEFEEPHRRGEVLVAAVMSAFLEAWVARITHTSVSDSKLVNRGWVAEEGATIADILLTMAIRAIDYTPPIHIEFGDYLSALLTADIEVRPDDSRYGLRQRLQDAFESFGIVPAAHTDNGAWTPPRRGLDPERRPLRQPPGRSDRGLPARLGEPRDAPARSRRLHPGHQRPARIPRLPGGRFPHPRDRRGVHAVPQGARIEPEGLRPDAARRDAARDRGGPARWVHADLRRVRRAEVQRPQPHPGPRPQLAAPATGAEAPRLPVGERVPRRGRIPHEGPRGHAPRPAARHPEHRAPPGSGDPDRS